MSADELLAKHLSIVLSRPVPFDTRSAWLGHIPFARWIIAAHRPDVLVELGTHAGASYFAFCQAVEDENLETRCFAVDTWEGDEHAGNYDQEIYTEVLLANEKFGSFSTPLRMTFDQALGEVADGSVDLLHIDGLHTLEAAKSDFESWLVKLSDRGIVLFHDISEKKDDFGVWILWEELQEKYPSFTFVHEHGLGVLGVGKNLTSDVQELFSLDADQRTRFRNAFETIGVPVSDNASRARRIAKMERREQGKRAIDGYGTEGIGRATDGRPHDSGAGGRKKIDADRARARHDRAVEEMRSSLTWRVGTLVLAPARILRGFRGQAKSRLKGPPKGDTSEPPEPDRGLIARDAARERAARRSLARISASERANLDRLSVSVILPFGNDKSWLAHAIRSVASQSFTKWELILVDDGSTDGSTEIAHGWAQRDPRVELISSNHRGPSGAMNVGLQAASGTHVAYLRPGHTWDRHYLRLMMAFTYRERCDVAYSGQAVHDDRGKKVGHRGQDFDWSRCAESNFVELSCLVHSYAVYDERGGFDEQLRRDMDWDLVLRYTHEKRVGFLAIPLSTSRGRSDAEEASSKAHTAYRAFVLAKRQAIIAHEYRDSAHHVSFDIAIKIAAPHEKRLGWGDFHYATSLAHYLRELGHQVRVDCVESWASKSAEVVIVLRGKNAYERQPGELVVLWSISHPDQLSFDEIEDADLVYFASDSARELYGSALTTQPRTLLQATDVRKFNTHGTDPKRQGLTFVGNTRKVFRKMVRWSLELDLPLRLIGRGWGEFVPASVVEAEVISNDELPDVYRSAEAVLNDHWDSMREHGYISNRLFDAIACGTPVISDEIPSLGSWFGAMVATVSSRDELTSAVDGLGSVSDSDRQLLSHYVLDNHGFGARATAIMDDVRMLLIDEVDDVVPDRAPRPEFLGVTSVAPLRVTAIARHGKDFPTSSAFIRLIAPFSTELARETIDFRLSRTEGWADHGELGDVVIVQRTAFDSLHDAERLAEEADKRGSRLVVDTDDDFLAIVDDHPQRDLYEPLVGAHSLLVRNARQNWFATKRLMESYSELTQTGEVVRNAVDSRIWRDHLQKPREVGNNREALRILYMGSRTHQADLELILPALEEAHEVSPQGLHLTLVGVSNDIPSRPWITTARPRGRDYAYPRFARWLRGHMHFDLGIAPLVDSRFNRGKSDVKLIEYAAMGLPPMYSRVGAYTDFENETGLGIPLANSASEWSDSLLQWADQRARLREMGARTERYAYEHRSVELIAAQLLRLLNEIA